MSDEDSGSCQCILDAMPSPTKRPDRTEIEQKLAMARERLETDRLLQTHTFKRTDLRALDWITPDEVREGLRNVFEEVQPAHYCGERPPMLADDPSCPRAELFPFCWDSAFLGRRMYFKLAFSQKAVWAVRLHLSTAR